MIGAVLFFTTCTPALAQQHVIANKDVTRPEIQNNSARPAMINLFRAEKLNGYNLISFESRDDVDVQRLYVEYSTDGVIFQSAGEIPLTGTGAYSFQHYLREDRPMLYRVHMLLKNMRSAFTSPYLLDGIAESPVNFYPTVITGNTINVNTEWPVERMTITSTNGTQVFAKDLNGVLNNLPVVIPSLGRGLYFVTFYGKGWQSSGRIIVS